MRTPTKRELRVAADRRAAARWQAPTKPVSFGYGRNRAERRASLTGRGIGASYPKGTIRAHGPRITKDEVVRETMAMVAEWPHWENALDDQEYAVALYRRAETRVANRRAAQRRRTRRAQRRARRITRRRG